jgi:hypothetical protein
MGPCKFCGIGKAKQAPVNKELNPKSSIPGERFFIDISNVKSATFGGTKYCLECWMVAQIYLFPIF